jgi:hypothetical protein
LELRTGETVAICKLVPEQEGESEGTL